MANIIRKILPCTLYCLGLIGANACATTINGYLSAFSVFPGGTIDVHTSTDSPTYDIQIYRIGKVYQYLTGINGITGVSYYIPTNGWSLGAGWPVSHSLVIPTNWTSGIYEVRLIAGSSTKRLTFTIKAAQPGATSNILVLDDSTTLEAYNPWGGKSLYTYNSTNHVAATTVSLLRPPPINPSPSIDLHEVKFVGWAESNNLPLEFASMLDLDGDPSLLQNYRLVVIVGHNEYWSKNMRDNFDNFVQSGGNAAILAANTMWWQVRIEGENMVCYKYAGDPLTGINDPLVTVNWYNTPLNDPENRSTGLSWRHGGYVNSGTILPFTDGYGGYTVEDDSSWIYGGTSVHNGDTFGYSSKIVGYEVDGAQVSWVNGKPIPTGIDGTPANYKILAYSVAYAPANPPTHDGNAALGIFRSVANGGFVFNAATTNWADGLATDSTVSQITYNVISILANPDLDADIDGLSNQFELSIDTNPLFVDSDNDGLSDFEEVNYDGNAAYTPGSDLNPLNPDTDGDTFKDGMEIAAQHNPLNASDAPVWGDINDDQVVDAADVIITTRAIMGLVAVTVGELARANVAPLINGKPEPAANGLLNAADLLLIERKALGLISY